MRKVNSDDVVSMLQFFKDLEDPRSTINRRHLLGDLIVICVLAVIAGADGPKAIGKWAQSKEEWLRRHLELPHGIPSHDTIGRRRLRRKTRADHPPRRRNVQKRLRPLPHAADQQPE